MLESSTHQSIWNPCFFEQGGLFELFLPWAEWILRYSEAFPPLSAINALMASSPVAPVRSGGGFPVQCVRQQRLGRSQRGELGWWGDYQLRIFFSGEVPTRPAHWHDFFNAWTWVHFPKVKAALNLRHFQCNEESQPFPWRRMSGNRNREQDFLTLFDEGGLIVVTDDDSLWQSICERDWREFFQNRRSSLGRDIAFYPVGHALYECALHGHPSIHASAIRVKMKPAPFVLGAGEFNLENLARIDEQAALVLSQRTLLRSPDDLHALPIWGLPGWHARAADPEFLSDSTYFR
ncbi:MAG: hypothetical protein RIR26_792 [Pseudomonadota bacterium]|jgi:hypothetical protein